VNVIAEHRRTNDRFEVDVRRCAVVADDFETKLGVYAREPRETVDQLGNMPAIEDGTDIQDLQSSVFGLRSPVGTGV
jgi:hypothetical protein